MASTARPTPAEAGPSTAGYLLKGLLAKLVFLAPWLLAAGRWDWLWPWLYTGLFVAFDLVAVSIVEPGLLAERASPGPGAKPWDRIYVGLAAVLLPLLAGIVSGLDLRFGWRPEVPPAAQWAATALAALGFAIVLWAMRANAYFSAVVRIQTERGHAVATGGPYRLVRHPGYVGAILFTLAMPVMFGSAWGLLPAALAALLYVLRTRREDETLRAELPGYAEFAERTRYRLLPGVW
jgi:protein-S-isoprenylcysteine O-methyltransferase Ste14